MVDRQSEHKRHAVFVKAFVLRGGDDWLPCTLVEISGVGARLFLDAPVELPDHFVLVLTERGVPRRYCRVRWRDKTNVGVSFEADPNDGKEWERELGANVRTPTKATP